MFALHLLSVGREGPNTSLAWLLYTGIVFIFLMIIVGWWVSSKAQDQPKVRHESPKSKNNKGADDLVKIEGIGPKVAKVLKDAGITSLKTLADAKAADVQKVLNAADLQMMNPEGWIAQAKLAMKGDWQTFEKLHDELKGGRKAG